MKDGDPQAYEPDRGDVVWLNFTPQSGREQAGRHPALVLSPRSYNARVGFAVLCPISRQVKGYPFEVVIPPGLAVTGAVLADQVKSLDWRVRTAEWLSTLPAAVVHEVLEKLHTLLE